MTGARRFDDAKYHLPMYGRDRVVEMKVRVGEDCRALDIWEPARAISESITRATLDEVASRGKSISCAAGCGACCRQLVPISALEATALLDVVERMPEERRARVRQRFTEAVTKMEQARLVDAKAPEGRDSLLSAETDSKAQWHDITRRYYALQIACPFLENESCGIYEDRPMICREYHVTTPKEFCATLDPKTEAIPWPVRMSEVLALAGGRITGTLEKSIPFALALEWAEAHGEAFRAAHDGEGMFEALVGAIDDKWEG